MTARVEVVSPLTDEQLEDLIVRHDLPVHPEYRALDTWSRCRVEAGVLRVCYGDDDGYSLHKGETFTRVLERIGDDLERQHFAQAVLDHRPVKSPIVELRTPVGECYVLDGQKTDAERVVPRMVEALLVDVKEVREII